jgi:hypothetical protein
MFPRNILPPSSGSNSKPSKTPAEASSKPSSAGSLRLFENHVVGVASNSIMFISSFMKINHVVQS